MQPQAGFMHACAPGSAVSRPASFRGAPPAAGLLSLGGRHHAWRAPTDPQHPPHRPASSFWGGVPSPGPARPGPGPCSRARPVADDHACPSQAWHAGQRAGETFMPKAILWERAKQGVAPAHVPQDCELVAVYCGCILSVCCCITIVCAACAHRLDCRPCRVRGGAAFCACQSCCHLNAHDLGEAPSTWHPEKPSCLPSHAGLTAGNQPLDTKLACRRRAQDCPPPQQDSPTHWACTGPWGLQGSFASPRGTPRAWGVPLACPVSRPAPT